MNILILSWRGPGHPYAGGAEVSTHEHAKGWVKAGHSVTLFTSYFDGAKKREVIDGIEIIRSGEDAFGVKIAALFWYLFGSHPKFDLVVDEFHGIPFFTPLYVRVKKLAFIHEVAKEVWWFNPWPMPFNIIPAIIGTIFERFIFMILYKNISFMTVSKSTMNELVAWGIPRRKISVIHNGINRIKVKMKKEKRKTAIFLGTLTKDKGIEDAIKVFGLINQNDPAWQYWILGKGDPSYVNYLKKLVYKESIKDKLKFWGYVSDRKRFELLARAHVFVNPSIREGWGLVIVEAASVGTPTVAYRVSGIRDAIVDGKTGLLADHQSPESLAELILKLNENRKLLLKLGTKAKRRSQSFSWKKSVKKSTSLITEM